VGVLCGHRSSHVASHLSPSLAVRHWLSTTLRERLAVGIVRSVPPRSEVDAALGEVLRALREKHGLSQEALAHEAGLTTGSLARIERGQANPTWTTVRAITRALGVSMAALGGAIDRASRD